MADQTIDFGTKRFTNLYNGPKATLLILQKNNYLELGDVLTIRELDLSNVWTGRIIKGTVAFYNGGAFFNLPSNQNLYYFNPLDMFPWQDYSATSTIVGWSSFTVKRIEYVIIGDTAIVEFDLRGTSNATTASFTLPFNCDGGVVQSINFARTVDNSMIQTTPGYATMQPGSNIVVGNKNATVAGWTAANTKSLLGQLIIRIA